jgi:DNA-binding response OmpR family regulator
MVRAMSTAGYDTLVAADGEVAKTMLWSLRRSPDLIITDFRIRKLGGEELAGWLAQHAPAVPVVFVSGHPGLLESSPLRRRALRKPFTEAELLTVVQQVLQRHEYRTRLRS